MKLHVALENGMLPDAYAKYGDPSDISDGLNLRSFPFEVTDIDPHARALAWIFIDWDSVPVCGLPWVHWCGWTRLSATALSEGLGLAIEEDESRTGLELFQGYNSAAKSDRAIATGYVGPCPPDKDHIYSMYVLALDEEPDLTEPFWVNELIAATRGHIIEGCDAQLLSRS